MGLNFFLDTNMIIGLLKEYDAAIALVEQHNDLPELKGFSGRNLKRMLGFYRAYPLPEQFVPQAVAQTHRLIMPQLVAPADGEMGGIDEV